MLIIIFATISVKHFTIGSIQNRLQDLEYVSISFFKRMFRKHGVNKLYGFSRPRGDGALERRRMATFTFMSEKIQLIKA